MFEKYDNQKILITGGLGFIGSTLAHHLLKYTTNITLVDSLIPSYGGNLFNIDTIKDQVGVNITDMRDENSMNVLVRDCDIIFNLAGTLSHIDSICNPITDLDINCRSHLTILESCRHYNPDVKIVFSGTRSQYGRVQYLPVDENHPMHPTDINGVNNVAGESYHILYHKIYGMRICSLRLTNTYGPRHQMKHSKQGYLNWFLRLAMEGQTIPIFGEGLQRRDLNYVDDVVEALMLVGVSEDSNGEIFNLGSGEPITLLDSLKMIIDVVGRGDYVFKEFPEEKKQIEIGDYYANYDKVKHALGWTPKTTLRQGLEQSLAFYTEHGSQYWSKNEVERLIK